jgi:hypothetical protein
LNNGQPDRERQCALRFTRPTFRENFEINSDPEPHPRHPRALIVALGVASSEESIVKRSDFPTFDRHPVPNADSNSLSLLRILVSLLVQNHQKGDVAMESSDEWPLEFSLIGEIVLLCPPDTIAMVTSKSRDRVFDKVMFYGD